MNLLRIGKIIVNLDHVIDILPGDPSGPASGGLVTRFMDGSVHTFVGDDALGFRAYLERTAKDAIVPQKDLEMD